MQYIVCSVELWLFICMSASLEKVVLPTLHTTHNFTSKEIVRVIIITATALFFISIQLISVPLSLFFTTSLVIISCLCIPNASMHAYIYRILRKMRLWASFRLDYATHSFLSTGFTLSFSLLHKYIHSHTEQKCYLSLKTIFLVVRIISETNLHY